MPKRLRKIILVISISIALVCIAWVAAPILITHPAHAKVGAAPLDLDAENVTFLSGSGAVIHGWLLPGRTHAGAVLLLHGVRANRLMEIGRARFLHQAGYAVLAIDFRAHGESTGNAITFGYLESRDVIAALAYLRQREHGERIGVIGTSMGGAAFLLASPMPRADAVVLEQVYPSINLALDHRMTRYLGPLGHALSPLALRLLSGRIGISFDQLRPIDRIRLLHAPLLLIGGDSDRYTLPSESIAMYKSAPDPKQLWLIPGAGHVDLQSRLGDSYRRRILRFFGQNLRGCTSSPTGPLSACATGATP